MSKFTYKGLTNKILGRVALDRYNYFDLTYTIGEVFIFKVENMIA